MPKESPASLVPHTTHGLDPMIDLEETCWERMDALFHCLDNIRALHFSLPLVHRYFRGLEKVWLERVAWRLQFLRDRKNLALSFSVEGKVVPWVAMLWPRPLPLELHLQVLGYITSKDWKPEDIVRTQLACCLVCRDWYHFCRGKFHTIVLRARRQLNKLNTSLPSAAYFIGLHVVQLSLAGDEHIHSSAPVYLAGKLPSMRHLAIRGEDKEFDQEISFVPHDSLFMGLRQYKTVTKLSLRDITFQSFWHFRRYIVALPALFHLHLDNVHLPDSDPFNQRVPSLYCKPRNLTNIVTNLSTNWNPLWLWTLPIYALPQSPGNPHLRPFLTPSDGDVMLKLVELSWWRDSLQRDFHWMYNEERQQCKSSRYLVGKVLILISTRESHYHRLFSAFQGPPTTHKRAGPGAGAGTRPQVFVFLQAPTKTWRKLDRFSYLFAPITQVRYGWMPSLGGDGHVVRWLRRSRDFTD